MPRNIAASKIGNGVISLLWQLRCHCIPDHDKFSSLSNKIFQMFVYGDAVMLRIGRYWPRKTVSVSNHLHMPVRPMPFCIVWPSFLFDCTFRKHLGNFWEFFGQMVYRPPWQKISLTPMNLIDLFTVSVAILVGGKHGKTRVSIWWSFRCNKQSLNN